MKDTLAPALSHFRHGTIVRGILPGFTVALTVSAAAEFVSVTYGGPVMLVALLLGLSLNFLSRSPDCAPGLEFTGKTVLRVGVALLGLRIAAGDVMALGLESLIIVGLAVAITVFTGMGLSRLIGRGSGFGVLIGGATAICGASAALALSAALPHKLGKQREISFVVMAVTTLSTAAMIIYPALLKVLGFGDQEIGLLLGATIHDVAQVVGAGYSISEAAGDTATIVKLFRVSLLLPVVLLVTVVFRSPRSGRSRRGLPIPVFILCFAALVAANSSGLIPNALSVPLQELSRWSLVLAVSAIGMSTSLQDILKVGFQPTFVVLGSTVVLLLFMIAAVMAFA